METVNNIASAASRAIWGDSTQQTTENETAGTEPVSGKTGNVEAGEPYDKGNDEPVNTTGSSTTDATLPTHLKSDADKSTSDTTTPSTTTDTTTPATTTGTTSTADTTTPSTNTKSDTTSKMADNLPASSLDKSAPTDDTSASGPPTDSATPAAGAETTPKAQTTSSEPSSKETVKDEADGDEATQQANLSAHGIQETKKEGDHAPKYDTFKTNDGPHIGDGHNDGRVGPDVPKGDLKEFEEKEETKEERKHDEEGDVRKETSAAGESGDSVDSAGKGEKVSLKDKIKAKLHKH